MNRHQDINEQQAAMRVMAEHAAERQLQLDAYNQAQEDQTGNPAVWSSAHDPLINSTIEQYQDNPNAFVVVTHEGRILSSPQIEQHGTQAEQPIIVNVVVEYPTPIITPTPAASEVVQQESGMDFGNLWLASTLGPLFVWVSMALLIALCVNIYRQHAGQIAQSTRLWLSQRFGDTNA